MMPLCMVISWVYSVAMMIQHIVAEKEHRLKEVRPSDGYLEFCYHRYDDYIIISKEYVW